MIHLVGRQLRFDIVRSALTTAARATVVAEILVLEGFYAGLLPQLRTTELAVAFVNDACSIAIFEAARHAGGSWKVAVEARLFLNVDIQDPFLAGYRNDGYLTVAVSRHL